eukprot:gene22608-biopygen8779
MHSIAVGIAHPDALRSCGICLSGCASEMHIVALLAGSARPGGSSRAGRRAPRAPQAAGQECLGGAGQWMGGWVALCAGGGRDFGFPPGRIPARKSAPRAARPPPRGARSGRADGAGGSGVAGSAFGRESTHKSSVLQVLQSVAIESKIHTWMESPAFAQFIGPSRARDPGVQTTRMDAVFQRLSRETLKCILGVRLAETMEMGQYRFPHHIKR